MANSLAPVAMTAISHPDSEGFISGALFEQGWSVQFRALDADSLLESVQSFTGKELSIFISTDLDGLDNDKLEILKTLSQKLYLFAAPHSALQFQGAVTFPESTLELATLIRSKQRAPLIQSQRQSEKITARVIAIASAGHGYGTTTLALNLAHELAILGKRTLLVDADPVTPSISQLLNQRQLRESKSWRSLHENLSLMELCQDNIGENIAALDDASTSFDFIILDLSILTNLSTQLTGRRWDSEGLIWASKYADQLWITAKSDLRGIEQLNHVVRDLVANEIKPKIRLVQVAHTLGRKTESELEKISLAAVQIKTLSPLAIPHDAKATTEASERQISLAECNPRGALRKSLEKLADNLSA